MKDAHRAVALAILAGAAISAAACDKKQDPTSAAVPSAPPPTGAVTPASAVGPGTMTTGSAGTPKEDARIFCGGVNACSGKSACETKKNACAGKNACKGQGILEMTAADCKAKGGTVEPNLM